MTLDAVGGVWSYALDLARGLTEQGDTITLALLGPAPNATQRAEAAAIKGATLRETGLPLDWLCSDAAPVRAAGAAIAMLADEVEADVVHLNTPALAAGTRFRQPVVAVSHGCVATWWASAHPGTLLPTDLAWHHGLTAQGLAEASALIAPTAAFAKTVASTYGLATPHVAVHNGRADASFAPGATPVARAFTAGRLWDKVKRADLLDRIAAVARTPIDAAGATTGPHGEQVAPSHLNLLGTLDATELAERLAPRPVFVSAAMFEPFGLAALEAAQAGCALVLADIPSARELWDGAAVFMPGSDPAAWARTIDNLVETPRLRVLLGEAARERAARYTAAAMVAATRAIHDTAAAPQRIAA